MNKREFEITRADLIMLAIAFDIARALRRDRATGEEYTIGKFSREYLNRSQSLVSKVLTGKAKSERVLKEIARFILDTQVDGKGFDQLRKLASAVLDR